MICLFSTALDDCRRLSPLEYPKTLRTQNDAGSTKKCHSGVRNLCAFVLEAESMDLKISNNRVPLKNPPPLLQPAPETGGYSYNGGYSCKNFPPAAGFKEEGSL